MSAEQLSTIARHFANTNSYDEQARTQSTQWLKNAEQQKGFSFLLLKLLMNQGVGEPIRLAAAIYFKNFIMMNWIPDEDQKDVIQMEDRNLIKEHILNLMLTSPSKIQAQLSHALGIISRTDFPDKWPKLLPEIISHFKTDDPSKLLGMLETAHSIFHKYRVEGQSEELFKEVVYVLEQIAKPILELMKKTIARIQQAQSDGPKLKQQFTILSLLLEVFLSLCSQDIPEFVEDNLDGFFLGIYKPLLKYSNPLLDPSAKDREKPAPIETVQAIICEILNLFTFKYEEQFNRLVKEFVAEVWALLTRLNDDERFDNLVAKAVVFLTTVVKKEWHKGLFAKESDLKAICEKVVIPQLKLRDSDVELFTSNGLEYLRRDIEGSDQETRRRMTVDFVQGLCVYFEQQVTAILKQYINSLLADYAKDAKNKWRLKDAAMYLVLALTVKGAVRAKGVTKMNPYINITEFLANQVVPELRKDINVTPILKADCLKFIASFRYQIPKEHYPMLIQLIYRYLGSDEFVVHTYAAYALERILTVQDNGAPRLGKDNLKAHLQTMLGNLFTVLKKEESKENQYVMRAIMRVCSSAEENIAPFVKALMTQLTQILQQVAKNPRDPLFNHYLFDSISCLIKYVCKVQSGAVGNFEALLFRPFQSMLTMESCQEFGPYVFQILSQLLELRKDVPVPYQKIFPGLTTPAIYRQKGNPPAVTRLLCAYLRNNPEFVSPKLEHLLGVFQKLNSNTKQDQLGFELLSAIIEYIPKSVFDKFFQEIVRQLMTRMKTKPTGIYSKNVIVFFSLYVGKHGVEALHNNMEKLTKGLFGNFYEKVWISNLPKVTGKVDKKIVTVGMTNLLCKEPAMINEPYLRLWPQALTGLVNMLTGIGSVDSKEDLGFLGGKPLDQPEQEEGDDLVNTKSFSGSFVRLHHATNPQHDPYQDVKSAEEYLSKHLQQLSSKFPKFTSVIQKVDKIQTIFQSAQVSL